MTERVSAAAPRGGGRPPLIEERRAMIAEWLLEVGALTVVELQDRFGVSPMTARRDLDELERRGVARRTHGGAVVPSLAAGEHSFRQRLVTATAAKTRLAEAAYGLLRTGETVFLDASSTTFFLARLIRERGLSVRVITNSLPVMQELSHSEAELVAIGGTLRRLTSSFVGPVAARTVREHFADRMVLSVTGLTADGVLTDVDPLEAEVKRAMLEQAAEPVLALDDSKLATRGRQAVARLEAVSLVLVEREVEAVRALGVDMRVV